MSNKETPFYKRAQKWIIKEIVLPFSVAAVVILFVLQAFQIPSPSMENTLLVGDFLLGLKFVYGSEIPYTDIELPGYDEPKRGDILIFKYPGDPEYPDYNPKRYSHLANLLFLGNYYWDKHPAPGEPSLIKYEGPGPKDFIKRCVGVSGDVIDFREKRLYVNGEEEARLPGQGKWSSNVKYLPARDNFGPMQIPSPGDEYLVDTLSLAQLHLLRGLIVQENPEAQVEIELNLMVDSVVFNDYRFSDYQFPMIYEHLMRDLEYKDPKAIMTDRGQGVMVEVPFKQFAQNIRTGFLFDYYTAYNLPPDRPLPAVPSKSGFYRSVAYRTVFWPYFDVLEQNISRHNQLAEKDTTDSRSQLILQKKLKLNGKEIKSYKVKEQAYFMSGDNRDNSSDSRFWGFVSRKSIKAKAFIIYFSIEQEGWTLANPISWLKLPFKIRWTRIGRLIHGV